MGQLQTAKAWGLTPNQWDELDPWDKAQMIVMEQTENKMREVERMMAERK